MAMSASCMPRGEPAGAGRTVVLPRRCMSGAEILVEIHLQTGRKYACFPGALAERVDTTSLGGKVSVEEAARLLAPDVREMGEVLVLSPRPDPARAEALGRLFGSTDADERRLACYQAGQEPDLATLPLLYAALGDRDESVRNHALRALVRIDDCPDGGFAPGRVSVLALSEGFPEKALIGFLRAANEPAENEWVWAATLLASRPCPAAAEALKRGAEHFYPRTAAAARRALDAIKSPPPSPFAEHPAYRRDAASAVEWQKRLAAPDAAERAAAARVLAHRGDVGAEPLLAAFAVEQDAGVRGELLLALGRKGGPEAWALLVRASADDDAGLRLAALRALAHCPEPRGRDRLLAAMLAPAATAGERSVAALSLGAAADETVVRKLAAYVETTDQPISAAALALSASGRADAVPALARCLERKNETLKQYAYGGLGRIGTPEAVEVMVRRYDEYDNDTRHCAHAALRRLRNPAGIDRVVALGRAGSTPIACHALEECADPRGVDMLIAALGSRNFDYVYLGLQALGRIGDPKALPAMLAVLDHDDENLRYEAWRALRWRWFWFRPDLRKAFRAHPVFRALAEPPPSPAEQPENSWVCRSWPLDLDDWRVCNTTYEAGVGYDEGAGAVLRWGSHGQRVDVPQLAETWLLRTAEGRWRQRDPAEVPAGSCGTVGLSYDRAGRRMVSVQSTGGEHGWQWERERMLRASSPNLYDSAADRWTMTRLPKGPGCRKAGGQVYVDPGQVHLVFAGWHGDPAAQENVWAYDLFANAWHRLPVVEGQPPLGRIYAGTVYLPATGQVLFTGGSYRKADNRTWLYDLGANAWTDRQAGGDPPKFMSGVELDPASGHVLGFQGGQKGPPAVWQYDVAANLWSRLPDAAGPTPHHEIWDACYDAGCGLFVIHGGLTSWHSDSLVVRETWTYKPRSAAPKPPERSPAPKDVELALRDGHAELSWAAVPGAAGYRVYRGDGALPWQVKFAAAAGEPGRGTSWRDPAAPAKGDLRTHYYVAALDKEGREGLPSLRLRAQPAAVPTLGVEILADRTIRLRWSAPSGQAPAGYHVYAAAIEPPKAVKATEMDKLGEFVRLSAEPVRGTDFLDPRPLAETEGVFGHEVRAYQVRAVDPLGTEGGPSPLVWSIPAMPARVRAEPRGDGSVAVRWEALADPNIRGYAVYRMDELRDATCTRLNAHPVRDTEFLDWPGPDLAGRRRYYVVAVDALGCEGIPSEGAWARGRP